jgi:hypothetical protein
MACVLVATVDLRTRTEMRASRLGLLVLFAWLGVSAPSQAQAVAPRASLVVTRTDGAQDCPDSVALAGQVRAIAGSDLIGTGVTAPAETFIQVAIVHDFGGYKAQIDALGRHHGARSLEDLGPSCASLAEAIAVTLAIFLDPYANAPALPPAISAAPAPSSAPLAPKPPVPEIPRRHSPRFLDASAGLSFALLEHGEPLLSGQRWPAFEPALGARAWRQLCIPRYEARGRGSERCSPEAELRLRHRLRPGRR